MLTSKQGMPPKGMPPTQEDDSDEEDQKLAMMLLNLHRRCQERDTRSKDGVQQSKRQKRHNSPQKLKATMPGDGANVCHASSKDPVRLKASSAAAAAQSGTRKASAVSPSLTNGWEKRAGPVPKASESLPPVYPQYSLKRKSTHDDRDSLSSCFKEPRQKASSEEGRGSSPALLLEVSSGGLAAAPLRDVPTSFKVPEINSSCFDYDQNTKDLEEATQSNGSDKVAKTAVKKGRTKARAQRLPVGASMGGSTPAQATSKEKQAFSTQFKTPPTRGKDKLPQYSLIHSDKRTINQGASAKKSVSQHISFLHSKKQSSTSQRKEIGIKSFKLVRSEPAAPPDAFVDPNCTDDWSWSRGPGYNRSPPDGSPSDGDCSLPDGSPQDGSPQKNVASINDVGLDQDQRLMDIAEECQHDERVETSENVDEDQQSDDEELADECEDEGVVEYEDERVDDEDRQAPEDQDEAEGERIDETEHIDQKDQSELAIEQSESADGASDQLMLQDGLLIWDYIGDSKYTKEDVLRCLPPTANECVGDWINRVGKFPALQMIDAMESGRIIKADERPDFSFGLVEPCEENVFDFTQESDTADSDGGMNTQDAEQATLLPDSYHGPDSFDGSESQPPESHVQEPAEVEPSTNVMPNDIVAAEAAPEMAGPSTDVVTSDIPAAAPEMEVEHSTEVIPNDDIPAAEAAGAAGLVQTSTDVVVPNDDMAAAAAAAAVTEPSTDVVTSDIPAAEAQAPEMVAEPTTEVVPNNDIAAAVLEMEVEPSTEAITSDIPATEAPEVTQPSTDVVPKDDIPAAAAEMVTEPSTNVVTSDIPAAAAEAAAPEMVAEPTTDVITSDIPEAAAEAEAAGIVEPSTDVVLNNDIAAAVLEMEVEPSTEAITSDIPAAAAEAAGVVQPSTHVVISDIPEAEAAGIVETSTDVVLNNDIAAAAAKMVAEPSIDAITSDIPAAAEAPEVTQPSTDVVPKDDIPAAAAKMVAEPTTDVITSDIPKAAAEAPEVTQPSADVVPNDDIAAEAAEAAWVVQPSADVVPNDNIAAAAAAEAAEAAWVVQPSADVVPNDDIAAEAAEAAWVVQPSADVVLNDDIAAAAAEAAWIVQPSADVVLNHDIPAAEAAPDMVVESSNEVFPNHDIPVAEAAAEALGSSSTDGIPRDFVAEEVVQPSTVGRMQQVETNDGHLRKVVNTIDGKQSIKVSKCRVSASFEVDGRSGALLEVGNSHRGGPGVSHKDVKAEEADLSTVDMEVGNEVHHDTVADQDQLSRSPSPAAACSARNSLRGSRSPQSGLGARTCHDSTAPITFASFRFQSTGIGLQRVMNTNEADRALSMARFRSCPIPSSEAGDWTSSIEMGGPFAPKQKCTQDDTNRLALEAFYAVRFPAEQSGIPGPSTSVVPLDLASSGTRQNVEARAAAEEEGEKGAVSEVAESDDEDWRPSPYSSDVDDDSSDEARALRDGGYVDENDSDGEDQYHCLLPPLPPHLVNAPSNIEIGSEEKLDEFIDMLKNSENVENALKMMKEDKAIVNFARSKLVIEGRTRGQQAAIERNLNPPVATSSAPLPTKPERASPAAPSAGNPLTLFTRLFTSKK